MYQLVDWCKRAGVSVIQILPINDMGSDSVPYAALSAFALDPVFLALDQVDAVAGEPELSARVRQLADRLNAAQRIDYQLVRGEKLDLLEEAFRQSRGPELQDALQRFKAGNPWLEDYLSYRVIKEREGYRSWETWARKYASKQALDAVKSDERYTFHLYLQWLLDSQFSRMRRYANENGILLEGDIPILVSRDSADVWRHPGFFKLEYVAGAPPDMYAEDGQKWGFPPYDWDSLKQVDCSWWRQRLRYAERFFDLYRIDHVVGFFRIWTIHQGAPNGREGWFEPWDESVWGEHGRALLSMMLDSTSMLPLAEDLGTVPPSCRQTLKELGICGMKVQRWEKRWDQDQSFIPPAEYEPLSVATLSTHDSETLAGWWEAFPEERQQLWNTLGHKGEAQPRLTPEVHRQILSWVAGGRSLFNIFMLQEFLEPFGLLPGDAADHRINVPGTVGDHNWTWRCPVTMEDLVGNDSLVAAIRETFSS